MLLSVRFKRFWKVGVLLCGSVGAVHANNFTFSFAGNGGDSASGTLAAVSLGSGLYEVVSGMDLNWNGNPMGVVQVDPFSENPPTSDLNNFSYDNTITPGNPRITGGGLLFYIPALAEYLNIYSLDPGIYTSELGTSVPGTLELGKLQITAIPLPEGSPISVILLGIGLTAILAVKVWQQASARE